jgi:hypothetical protein
MSKIKKVKQKYALQKIRPMTNVQLKDLSDKKGSYIIDILAELVDREYQMFFK